jgi:DNA-binding transcriptional regulator LsrR (DeoR family)
MATRPTRIGETFVDLGHLTVEELQSCLEAKAIEPKTTPPPRLGDVAVVRGLINEAQRESVETALAEQCHRQADNQNLRLALRSIAEGRAILFAGAGFSVPGSADSSKKYLTGEAIKQELCQSPFAKDSLKDRQISQLENMPLPDVAQWFEKRNKVLMTRILEDLSTAHIPANPLGHHHLLARLNAFRFIVTTNWDNLIEDAFAQLDSARPISIIQEDADLVKIRLEKTSLVKLHGSFRDGRFEKPPIISTSDFIRKRERNPLLYGLIKALFAAYDVIVIGFRPDDYNFAYLHAALKIHLEDVDHRSIYVVDPDEAINTDAFVTGGQHIALTSASFFDYLSAYLAFSRGSIGMSSCPPGRYGDTADTSPNRFWSPRLTKLAKTLRNKFDLDHVEIAPTEISASDDSLPDKASRSMLGMRAAALMADWTCDGDSVCVGGGDTTKWLVSHVDPAVHKRNLTVYAGSIRAFPGLASLSSTTTLSLLVEALRSNNVRGKVFPMQRTIAEYRLRQIETGERLSIPLTEIERQVQDYFDEASKSRLAILGIGALNNFRGGFAELAVSCCHDFDMSEDARAQFIRRVTLSLQDAGFVGDVLARPLKECMQGKCFMDEEDVDSILKSKFGSDQHASSFLKRLHSYCWSLSPHHLVQMARNENQQSIVLASGSAKGPALLAALRCKLFSTMIIDEDLAVYLERDR